MRRIKFCMSAFAGDQRGSVAILFALSIFVLLGCAGVAIDFARAHSSKTALQQDLDAAILFAANEKARQGDNFDEQSGAQKFMEGLRRQKQIVGDVVVEVTKIGDNKFRGNASAKIPSTILRVLGGQDLKVNVTAEAEIGENPLEIALVLDNTGSMEGAKLGALLTASKDLIDTAFEAPGADKNVKISVVPFAEYVNVGQANRNAPWLSVAADASSTQNVCQDVPPATVVPGSCKDVDVDYEDDGKQKQAKQNQCDYTYGPPVNQCSDITTATAWNGCVGSRAYPLNVQDGTYSTKVPGVMDVSCHGEITPLTNNKDTAKTAIDAMWASGNTYIPAGLMWGWATLSKDAPYDQGLDLVNGTKVRKIIVLMTDGQNTISPSGSPDGRHDGADTALANQYTTELCNNIKAENIEVYSVAFEVPDLTIKQILENCASAGNKYFDASNGSDLADAFAKIAADFAPLRLTR
jgi:Flp pilus assembly protein TadG